MSVRVRFIAVQIYRFVSNAKQLLLWPKSSYSVPSPKIVKWSVLKRWGANANFWIETGTYRGETTRFLSSISKEVHSIEPSFEIFEKTSKELKSLNNVFLYFGTSEELLASVLSKLIQQHPKPTISFWLDGHHSDGKTFFGKSITPIEDELRVIAKIISQCERVSVMIDDFRLFRDTEVAPANDYPKRKILVEWAESNSLSWTVEHDIFIATSLHID